MACGATGAGGAQLVMQRLVLLRTVGTESIRSVQSKCEVYNAAQIGGRARSRLIKARVAVETMVVLERSAPWVRLRLQH